MGSMGVYAGLIYNDYFSLGLDLFGSNYTFKSHESGAKVSIYPVPVYGTITVSNHDHASSWLLITN